ncbi:MAG: hypothetical protein HOO89_11715 [Ferruginibacter sp.]|nr:hypothetical protein [Ferruginibacter sp.]
MKNSKYLIIAFLFLSCLSVSEKTFKKNNEAIFTLLANKFSGAENASWLGGKTKIPERFLNGDDTLKLKSYIKSTDSIYKIKIRKNYYILINDTCINIKETIDLLRYSITNNKQFFFEYLKNDTSFKELIFYNNQGLQKNLKIHIELIKSKYKIKFRNSLSVKVDDELLDKIIFSNIVYDKNYLKAIVYAIAGSSGTVYFLNKINSKWEIKHQLQLWVH